MQRVLRSLFVCLFAVTLVFNGGAFRVLANTPAAHSHHTAVASIDAGHQGQHEAQYLGQLRTAAIALDQAPAHDHVNGSPKCCSMCIALDNLTPLPIVKATRFQYRAVIFKIGRRDLAGHLVALDPDIPKTIV